MTALIPYDPREAISPAEASRRWNVPKRTLLRWAEEKGIGRTICGRVMLSKPALLMLLEDDVGALQRYASGDRASEEVCRYFNRCALQGLPLALREAQEIMRQTRQTRQMRQTDLGTAGKS